MIRRALVHLGLAAAIGCGGGDVAILDGDCVLEGESGLATLDGPAVHDLVLVTRAGGAWAAWSEDSGLYVAGLDEAGAVALAPRRIGPPCPAGIDGSGEPLLLACARRADDAKDDPGVVVVYEVTSESVHARDRFEPVGPAGLGVAIAAMPDGYHLAWHDGRAGVSTVWAIDVRAGDAEARRAMHELMPETPLGPTALRVSRPGMRAGPPSLLRVGEHRYLAWAETSLDDAGDPIGELLVQFDDGAPRSVATIQHETATPQLSTDGERVLVTFRDRRRRGRPRAYAMWVPPPGEDGTLVGGAPANTDGPALAVPCAGSVLAVAPRTHSRHERLVSVRRHDAASLEGMGPELQLYEHGAPYEHAAAACVGAEGAEHVMVLFAARESDDHEAGEVRATNVRCEGE